MLQYRTDLAMEAHELLCARSRAQTLSGVDSRTVFRRGCSVTSVRIDTEGAARQLGKPRGRYVTLDLSPLQKNADDVLERASRAVGAELRALLGENVKSVLVAGLGNANMTPDAIGPRSAEHVLVTRHLRQNGAFSAFCSVSVLTPGVLGRTGIEAMETLRGTVRAVQPDAVIAIDALASRSLMRLCSTVQLSDTGIVPGSGVGNHRCPLSRDTLGVPVYAIGVPTVVDAATLTLDVLEEAGKVGRRSRRPARPRDRHGHDARHRRADPRAFPRHRLRHRPCAPAARFFRALRAHGLKMCKISGGIHNLFTTDSNFSQD